MRPNREVLLAVVILRYDPSLNTMKTPELAVRRRSLDEVLVPRLSWQSEDALELPVVHFPAHRHLGLVPPYPENRELETATPPEACVICVGHGSQPAVAREPIDL